MKENMKGNLLRFAAMGAIALGGFTLAQAQDPGPESFGGWHGHGHGFALEHLTKTLNLTSDQETKVKPIIDQARPQIMAIHKDVMKKTEAVIDNTMSLIRPLLNSDQQKKFDALQKARQDMRAAQQELHAAMSM